MSGGILSVKKEDLKKVQSLKKILPQVYCTFANLLASQRDYTVAVYKYVLTLGPMDGRLYLC